MLQGITALTTYLRNRLPDQKQFLPVLSTVVFIVFSWAIYHAFYQVPGWLFYTTLPGVLVLFAYILGFALIESLMVSAFLAAYCLFLPENWLKRNFAAQGCILAILLALMTYLLRNNFDRIQKLEVWQMAIIPLAIFLGIALVSPLLAILFERFPKLTRIIEGIGERLTIFSYIYIPLGILGWLVVLIRNIF